jgi:hypothetical protein
MTEDIVRAYAAAMDFQAYRACMRVHARALNDVYERLEFVRSAEAGSAPLGKSHVFILTEDFCIDSVLNVPLIARLVEASPDAELRIASRDAHRRIADDFTGRGGVSRLPTAILLDRDWHVRGHWSERSKVDHQWMEAFLAHDPIREIVLEDGQPAVPVAEWMERRLEAQLPFLESTSWRSVRDELSAIVRSKTSSPALQLKRLIR